MKFKLGRNRSRFDRRTLWIGKYLDPATLPPLPAARDWTVAVTAPWQMLGNGPDRTITPPIPNFQGCGDCVCVAGANKRVGWNYNAQRVWTPTANLVLQDYTAITGYDASQTAADGSNPTDAGTDPLTYLKYARAHGICGGPPIGAWAAINTQRQDQVSYTVELFGSAFLAFALPDVALASEDAMMADWILPPGQEIIGDWASNPQNGHMMEILAYDPTGVTAITWGTKKKLNWPFVLNYCDEGYAVFSTEILNGQLAPNGFDQSSLLKDLTAVTSMAA